MRNGSAMPRPDAMAAGGADGKAGGVLDFQQVQLTAYGVFHYWDLHFNDLPTAM